MATSARTLRATALMATMGLAGCVTSWQPQQAPPAQLLAATGETRLQVRLASGIRVVLRDPGIEGDSLVGWQQPPGDPAVVPVARRAFALSDVRSVSVKKSNTGANIAIGAAIGAAAFVASVVVAWVIVCGSSGCD